MSLALESEGAERELRGEVDQVGPEGGQVGDDLPLAGEDPTHIG